MPRIPPFEIFKPECARRMAGSCAPPLLLRLYDDGTSLGVFLDGEEGRRDEAVSFFDALPELPRFALVLEPSGRCFTAVTDKGRATSSQVRFAVRKYVPALTQLLSFRNAVDPLHVFVPSSLWRPAEGARLYEAARRARWPLSRRRSDEEVRAIDELAVCDVKRCRATLLVPIQSDEDEEAHVKKQAFVPHAWIERLPNPLAPSPDVRDALSLTSTIRDPHQAYIASPLPSPLPCDAAVASWSVAFGDHDLVSDAVRACAWGRTRGNLLLELRSSSTARRVIVEQGLSHTIFVEAERVVARVDTPRAMRAVVLEKTSAESPMAFFRLLPHEEAEDASESKVFCGVEAVPRLLSVDDSEYELRALATRMQSLIESAGRAASSARSSLAAPRAAAALSELLEHRIVPGVGEFTMLADGRVKVLFEDRTLLRIGFSKEALLGEEGAPPGARLEELRRARLTRWLGAGEMEVRDAGDGTSRFITVEVPGLHRVHVRHALSFIEWALLGPAERLRVWEARDRGKQRAAAALSETERWLAVNDLLRADPQGAR